MITLQRQPSIKEGHAAGYFRGVSEALIRSAAADLGVAPEHVKKVLDALLREVEKPECKGSDLFVGRVP